MENVLKHIIRFGRWLALALFPLAPTLAAFFVSPALSVCPIMELRAEN